jgi:hypothetical protein
MLGHRQLQAAEVKVGIMDAGAVAALSCQKQVVAVSDNVIGVLRQLRHVIGSNIVIGQPKAVFPVSLCLFHQ